MVGELFVNLSPHGLRVAYTSEPEWKRLEAKRRDAYRWLGKSQRALAHRGRMVLSVYGRWHKKLMSHELYGNYPALAKTELAPGIGGALGELHLVKQ